MRPLVDKAVSWARIRYPASRIAVAVRIDGEPVVRVHPVSLELVLNNLVGNCFQHVTQGRLTIGFEGNCLMISDNGPGLGTDAVIPVPFAGGGSSSGSGLGLDICRRLCQAMRIDLNLRSGTDGERGTYFRLVLPES